MAADAGAGQAEVRVEGDRGSVSGREEAAAERDASHGDQQHSSMEEMALFMDKLPEDVSSNPDLAALQSLLYDPDDDPVEAAENFKEQGNKALRRGPPFYRNALKFYTQAIEVGTSDKRQNAVYRANRAHVHLLQRNNGKALADALAATELDPSHLKARYRAAKAALALSKLEVALHHCQEGLKIDPNNKELSSIKSMVEQRLTALEGKRALERRAEEQAQVLVAALKQRGVHVGPQAYVEHSRGRRPYLDSTGVHAFVVCHSLTLLWHVFAPSAPQAQWDVEHKYRRDTVELYYHKDAAKPFSDTQLLKYIAQAYGGPAMEAVDTEDALGQQPVLQRAPETQTLKQTLSASQHVIPGIPVLYVLAKGTGFRERVLRSIPPDG
eukprot:jgi/Chlat1/4627/Chrsp3S00434